MVIAIRTIRSTRPRLRGVRRCRYALARRRRSSARAAACEAPMPGLFEPAVRIGAREPFGRPARRRRDPGLSARLTPTPWKAFAGSSPDAATPRGRSRSAVEFLGEPTWRGPGYAG